MASQSLIMEHWSRIRRDPARAVTVGALALFGFSIPIGPQYVSYTTAIVILVWLFRGRFRRFPGLIAHNPVVRAAAILFGLFIIGMAYGSADLSDALLTLKKYRELILIPILMSLADSEEERRIAILGFMAAMLLSLVLAYGEIFGLLNIGRYRETTAFQHRIVFSILLAYFLFWAAHRTFDEPGMWRWFWAVIVLAGTYFLFHNVASRTGYVTVPILAVLFAFQRFSFKGAVIAAVGVAAALTVFYFTSDIFAYRVARSIGDISKIESGEARGRIRQWRTSVAAIGAAPIIGHGTGSFPSAFRNSSESKRYGLAQPHNEYLLITVQIGIFGLAAFLWLLFTQWRAAGRAPPPRSHLGQGLVLSFAVVCVFNSSLFNSPEGHMYAFMTAMLFAGTASRSEENGSM